MRNGQLTVVDATNIDWMWRTELIRHAREHGRRAVAIVLDLPAYVCLARNSSRQRTVRPGIVRQQVAELRRASGRLDLEGFAAVHLLRSVAQVDHVDVVIAALQAR